mmetsp:Transcript_160099/g.292287  ORF Transcript_160099/g.292287 Transcript_160099/m.292287 type:complete len:252 (+) Transcript_160099:1184-1939(+)
MPLHAGHVSVAEHDEAFVLVGDVPEHHSDVVPRKVGDVQVSHLWSCFASSDSDQAVSYKLHGGLADEAIPFVAFLAAAGGRVWRLLCTEGMCSASQVLARLGTAKSAHCLLQSRHEIRHLVECISSLQARFFIGDNSRFKQRPVLRVLGIENCILKPILLLIVKLLHGFLVPCRKVHEAISHPCQIIDVRYRVIFQLGRGTLSDRVHSPPDFKGGALPDGGESHEQEEHPTCTTGLHAVLCCLGFRFADHG